MRRIAVSILALALALPLAAQEPPRALEEKIDVNAVLLDVIVTDKSGNQILGLTKDDFVVKENGVAQAVDSADYFTNRRNLDQREENAPFKVEKVKEQRYFVFFFDRPADLASLHDELTRARMAARGFVRKEMKDTDLVAIVGHDVRLKVYSDFTSDKARLERAIEEAARFGPGITGSAAAGVAPSILRSLGDPAETRSGTVYRAIDALADALRPIPARKNLVIFSPGIVDQHEVVREGMIITRSPDFDPMLESLNAANVSVYALQLLRNADMTPLFHQRLEEMSDATGGRYFRFNTSFANPLQKIENANAGYYLVTYQSRHPRGENGFQKVDVSVKNPEFRVVARAGYLY